MHELTVPVDPSKGPVDLRYRDMVEWYITCVPPEELEALRRSEEQRFIGDDVRVGWRAALKLYFFWCRYCKHFAVDYLRGFLDEEYFICSACKMEHPFIPPPSWLQVRVAKFGELISKLWKAPLRRPAEAPSAHRST